MAVQFDGGVIVGADSRTTTGSYIVRLTLSRPIYLSERHPLNRDIHRQIA